MKLRSGQTTEINSLFTNTITTDKSILSLKKNSRKNLEKNFDQQKFCSNCNEPTRSLGALGICFECFRKTPEYKNNEYIKIPKEIDYSYQTKFNNKKKSEYFNELTTIEYRKSDFAYNSFLQFIGRTNNIVLDSNQTIHLKGLDYSISFFYNIKPPSKFYRFDTTPNRETLTQILPFINTQKITIETFIERLFWDSAEYIYDTDFIEFCRGIIIKP
ncbi:hypothetical protein ES708_04055 [subsurface metagenome]